MILEIIQLVNTFLGLNILNEIKNAEIIKKEKVHL